jgi:SAM-dependent methyltransferase
MGERDWRTVFEETYSGASDSRVMERVWRAALGDEYPAGIDPYSYVTNSELQRFADELHVVPGATLADIGCGRGGAGLWVASATGASLIGIDIAEAPLVDARVRAEALGLAAEFRRGEFEATGLDDASVDAVMSVDALLFTPDKAAAMRELRRVMRPGGRLVLTSWDYHTQPLGRPPQVPDHRPLLEPAGLRLLAYEDTPDWRAAMTRIHNGLLEEVDALAAEQGVPADEMRAGIEEMHATVATMTRRFRLVAETA